MEQTVLIVEDEPGIMKFIASYVENEGYKAIPATCGREAIEYFDHNVIDLVLLDLMLPDLSGEAICRRIREISDVPIIMITAKTDDASIIAGLEMGADDYITKPFSPRQMIARINALFRRTSPTTIDSLESGLFKLEEDNYRILFDSITLPLTATEYQVLATLIRRPSKIFTRSELSVLLSKDDSDTSNRIIDSHIKNIRSKLSEFTPRDYIKTVRGLGYKFNDTEEKDPSI